MSAAAQNLKWGIEQRLEFIEFQLFWEGGVNRSDITSRFGVSVPQASKDLAQYQEIAVGNVEYDKSEKRYRASASFTPLFLDLNSEQYLAQLSTPHAAGKESRNSQMLIEPEVASNPKLVRRVEPTVLRAILESIRLNSSVDLFYQSLNIGRPEPKWRRVRAHAFANDGMRWHVRAFCHENNKYKDFLLSRCLRAEVSRSSAETAPVRDDLWQETIQVELVPNPLLSEPQKRAVAVDYAMHKGSLKIQIRKAMLYYFWKRFRFDVADRCDEVKEAPIVINNRAEFDAALAEAML